MVTRDSLAGASAKAFLVVFGFLCASTASGASRAPLRAPLAPTPPLVAQLAVELRSAPPQAGPFATAAFDAPLLSIIAPRVATPPRESHFDIAAELVTEQQRAVAAALDAWVRQTSNAERARQRRAVAARLCRFRLSTAVARRRAMARGGDGGARSLAARGGGRARSARLSPFSPSVPRRRERRRERQGFRQRFRDLGSRGRLCRAGVRRACRSAARVAAHQRAPRSAGGGRDPRHVAAAGPRPATAGRPIIRRIPAITP